MTSARIALRLGLGILCGLALVLVPLVFSSGASSGANPASPATYSTAHPPPPTNSYAPLLGLSPLSGASPAGLSFLIITLFIFLPSTIFSLVIRRWAEKRARDYL